MSVSHVLFDFDLIFLYHLSIQIFLLVCFSKQKKMTLFASWDDCTIHRSVWQLSADLVLILIVYWSMCLGFHGSPTL